MEQKEYSGYGYHGGGRKPIDPGKKAVFKTVSISGRPEQIQALKDKATAASKTVSRLVLDTLLEEKT